MGKKLKQWRYLKRPMLAKVELDCGWKFYLSADHTIIKREDTDQGRILTVAFSAPGTGSAVSYEGAPGPTISLDHVQDERTGRWLLHLMVNMSRFEREPSWDEWRQLREAFFPLDVDTAIILPSTDQYVNVAEWVFHLWQLPEVWSVPTWGLARRKPKAAQSLQTFTLQEAASGFTRKKEK